MKINLTTTYCCFKRY